MSKGWRTALVVFLCLLLFGGIVVGGLWYLANQTDPVAVSPVSYHVLGYSDDAPTYDGTVSTNNLQSVYLSGTQTIKEIYVTEGQTVQKGTPLFRYDTSLTDIQLERQRLAAEQAQLYLKEAQEELAEIRKMKPYTPPPTTRPTTAPTTAPLEPVEDLPHYICGTGTEANPYRYLWDSDLEFDEDFLLEHFRKDQTECYIAFEVRERNALAGDLMDIWGLHVIRKVVEPTTPEEEEEEEATEPTEEGEEPTEPTEATEPTESTEPTLPTLPDGSPMYTVSYRFFYPEEIDHVIRPTVPEVPETEWVDTSSGYTSAEIAVMRQEKEKEIRDLDLTARMEKLRYESMKLEMGTAVVSATINGTVQELKTPDEALSSATPLMQISEGGTFFVTITLGEYERQNYKLGSVAVITSWLNYGYSTYGSLVSVSDEPVQDDYYGYYGSGNPDVSKYEAVLAVPAEAKLQEGEWVGVSFRGDKSQNSDVMYLENAYIRDENGRSYVYIRNEQGLLQKVYVQTGTIQWGYTAILDGLSEEDWIAFPYGKDVKDGTPTYEDEDEYDDEYYDDYYEVY